MKRIIMLLSVVMFVMPGLAGEVSVKDSGERIFVATSGQHKGHNSELNRFFTWQAADTTYQIFYRICTDKTAHPNMAECRPGDAHSIGLTQPTSCNWYGNGFLTIVVNGKDIDNYKADFKVYDDKVMEGIWDLGAANVSLNFTVLEGEKGETRAKLKVQGSITAKEEIQSVKVILFCIPNSGEKERTKYIATNLRTEEIPQGKSVALDKQEAWVVYYDKLATQEKIASGKYTGPCAVKYEPAQVEKVVVWAGISLSINTTINYAKDTKKFELYFWEFKDLTNESAIEYMKKPVEKAETDITK